MTAARITLAIWLAAALRLDAQTVASRINAVKDGSVQLSFAARPGVCGDGRGSVWIESSGRSFRVNGRQYSCVTGPIRVTLGRSNGETVSVRSCVACAVHVAAANTDLGEVAPAEAARYLVGVARDIGGASADAALSAAAFAADVDIAPELSRLARDEGATMQSRKQALFWFGQSDAPTADLVGLYSSLHAYELREHFTFVLSQRREPAATAKLIDIARTDPDHAVRKQAMFWLGQSKDSAAIRFFRDVLLP